MFGRGFNNFDDKWNVLAPYKYSIAIENTVESDYFTEKISDCFVSLTFPFYYGCPNIKDYFNSQSYELININDFYGACGIIKKIINDDNHYKKKLEFLVESKNKIINQYSLIPLVANFIKNNYGINMAKKQNITLEPEEKKQNCISRLINKLVNYRI